MYEIFITIIAVLFMLGLCYSMYRGSCNKRKHVCVVRVLEEQIKFLERQMRWAKEISEGAQKSKNKAYELWHVAIEQANSFVSKMHKCPNCTTAMKKYWANKVHDTMEKTEVKV